jgi:phosphoribosylformylglycinamidine synthase
MFLIVLIMLFFIEKIKRIERGIIYHFDRSVTDKKAVLSVIMDKMTESELCSIDEAHSIFDDFEPRTSSILHRWDCVLML